MKKIYIVSGSHAYRSLFAKMGYEATQKLSEATLVCFTGGEDVTPALYSDKQHPETYNSVRRDEEEQKIFKAAIRAHIPMVGICRGAQFLNVMSGGRMYQHVEKHTQSHYITDIQTGEVVYVSSTHHQMMMPSGDGVLIASTRLGGSREWYAGEIFKRDVSDEDIEVVYYPATNCLCFQPHPEFTGAAYDGMTAYFEKCVKTYLGVL
jgi:GMP synthase-like glutamine amidotransferase